MLQKARRGNGRLHPNLARQCFGLSEVVARVSHVVIAAWKARPHHKMSLRRKFVFKVHWDDLDKPHHKYSFTRFFLLQIATLNSFAYKMRRSQWCMQPFENILQVQPKSFWVSEEYLSEQRRWLNWNMGSTLNELKCVKRFCSCRNFRVFR